MTVQLQPNQAGAAIFRYSASSTLNSSKLVCHISLFAWQSSAEQRSRTTKPGECLFLAPSANFSSITCQRMIDDGLFLSVHKMIHCKEPTAYRRP